MKGDIKMGAVVVAVGSDIGYSNTKHAFADGEIVTYPSLAAATPAGIGLADAAGTDLRYRMIEPHDMLVGRYAYAQKIGQPNLTSSWFDSDEYMALVLAGLCRNDSFHNSYQMVTGLPVNHLDLKEKLQERLNGTHAVTWKHSGTPQHVAIEAHVVSQGVGAVATQLLNKDGIPLVPVDQLRNDELAVQTAVVDCGGGTTCCLSLRGFHTIAAESRSLAVGAWAIEGYVREALNHLYGEEFTRKLGRHELLYRVRGNSLTRFGKPVPEAWDFFDAACIKVASVIVPAMHDLWADASMFSQLILCGGGSVLLEPYLRKHFPSAQLIENPVQANAIGYLRLAKGLLK